MGGQRSRARVVLGSVVPLALLLQVLPGVLGTSALAAAAPDRTVSASASPEATSTTYVPLTPARLMDTRASGQTVDGVGAKTGVIGAATPRSLHVLGRGGVPADGVSAVVVNVAAVQPTSDTYLTVYPAGGAPPRASNLNVGRGETSANLVIVKVGQQGSITFANGAGRVDVTVDVSGYFPAGAGYTALDPGRLMDTRATGLSVDGQAQRGGPLRSGEVRQLRLAGRYGIPTTGVAAVVLNVTGVKATAATYATVWPAGAPRPNASNLNLANGDTKPVLVIAKVGDGGAVSISNAAGLLNMVVDVSGWISTGTTYRPMTPARLTDSRPGGLTIDGKESGGGVPTGLRDVQVVGRAGIPTTATAVVLNITAIRPDRAGFVSAFPAWEHWPETSTVNLGVGEIRSNLVVVKVGVTGKVRLLDFAGNVNLAVDVAGWFADPSPGGAVALPDGMADRGYYGQIADQGFFTSCKVTPVTPLPPNSELYDQTTGGGDQPPGGGDPKGSHWQFMFLPPHWGTYYFTLHYECVDGTSMDVAYSLYAAPAPLVAEWPYPDRGVVGNDYRLQLTAQGGVAPYSWSLTAGTLPPGFTLSSSGLLVAEPAQSSGEFPFTVLVTDAWGTTTSQNLRLDVQDYLITSLGYGPGTVGQPYAARGELDPAGAPYTLELRSGTIPPGLTLNSQTGRLEGSPTTVGSFAPFIRVHDAQGRLAYLNYVVEILAFHGVPQFEIDSMPNGVVGSPYQVLIAITGGNAGYNLSFPDGGSPPGLALRTLPCEPNSSLDCKFFVGEPTTAGTYMFVIGAEDRGGLSTSRQFVITVDP